MQKRTLPVFFISAILFASCNGNKAPLPPDLEVPEGFIVEVAAGPDLVDYPMFGMVDETGRLFLFESTGNVYEKTLDALENPQFRINVLEDLDGDGTYDKSTIYADSVGFPQGGVFYNGSLIVTSAPDLIRFTDTDGDGVADEREVLLSGWVLNVNANSLIGPFMAPDGWLYMTSAIEGFDVTTKEGERLQGETARVWRVRPDGSDLEWVSAGGMNNPVGLTFTEASEPIGTQTYFTDPKAGQRDALMYWTEGGVYPKPNNNITRDGLPLTGDLMPVVTKYSRVAPSGIRRYRDVAFGDDYYDNLFSAQFNTHRVLRHKLIRDGATFRTEDEIFFSSPGEDFHPTDVVEDADGSMLVVETGGWFIKGCPLSQVSKPELQGAIYRIRKQGAKKVDDPYGNSIDWASISPAEAANYLEDPRPFVADRAANALVERGSSALNEVTNILTTSSSVNARTRSVFVLYRINTPESLVALRHGFADPDLQVRIAAARSAGLAKDQGSVDQLMTIAQNDEPSVRRQAATALGQIGDARAITALLSAAGNSDDRFLEHAIIFAMISINRPDAVDEGLKDPSTGTKKAALIALDQMKRSSLTAGQVTAFLTAEDSILQRTALWVATHHPEWSGELIAYLKTELNTSSISKEKEKLIRELLISFCGNAVMQQFVAQLLDRGSQDRKLFLLDAMAACDIEQFPITWTHQLGNELTGTSGTPVKLEVLKLIRLREITVLDRQLESVAGNAGYPPVLRIGAIGALQDSSGLPSDHFNYLTEQLQSDSDAPTRQQAASVLADALLSDEQLIALADQLAHADAFTLPRIMPVFNGGRNADVGRAVASALTNSPSLDNFTEEYIREAFVNYPSELNPLVEQLISKLNEARSERLSRIRSVEGNITNGDIERGRMLFFGKAICYTCHAIGDEGGTFGPDLTSIQRDRSVHDLVEAIIYPSVSFVREYETYEVKTTKATYTGIIQEQTDAVIVIGISPQESVRIPIKEITSTEIKEVSVMPQGLDQLLSEQEMADLMAFLIGQDQDPETDADLLR